MDDPDLGDLDIGVASPDASPAPDVAESAGTEAPWGTMWKRYPSIAGENHRKTIGKP